MTLMGNRQGYAIKESIETACGGGFWGEVILVDGSAAHYRDSFEPTGRAERGTKPQYLQGVEPGIPASPQPAGIYSGAVLKSFRFSEQTEPFAS